MSPPSAPWAPGSGCLVAQLRLDEREKQPDLYARRSSTPRQFARATCAIARASSSYPHGRETHISSLSYPRRSIMPVSRDFVFRSPPQILFIIFAYRLHAHSLAARQVGALAEKELGLFRRERGGRNARVASHKYKCLPLAIVQIFTTTYIRI